MITGVVLARNEAENIVDCLRHLRPHVEELLLIDMESSDATVELSRPLVDGILSHPCVPRFDAARNIAAGACKFDWLWFIDADERVPEQTGQIVRGLIQKHGQEIAAISIPFRTYFCGRWIQHSGWWPGYTMPRVLKRGHFRFAERLHGGVEFDGKELRLPPEPELAIQHFSYRSITHYVEKFNRYTSTESHQLAGEGASLDWRAAVRAMVRDWWLYYERNSGHLDGYHGWILAWLAGQYRWFSHVKLLDQKPSEALFADVPKTLDDVIALMQEELSVLRGVQGRASEFGLLFRSPLRDPSGYADDGRSLLKSLAAGDYPIRAEEIPWSNSHAGIPLLDKALISSLQGNNCATEVTITNCIPTLCKPDPTAKYNVLRTTFETDRIPFSWLPLLEKYDELWVCSHFNAKIFRQCGVSPEKIKVVTGFLDTGWLDAKCEIAQPPFLQPSRFVFLSIFDWQFRKGWDVLLRAYVKEFSSTDGTGMLLKISRQHGYSLESVRAQANQVLEPMGHSLLNRPDIVIWDETLSQQQIGSLYKTAHAFVLASRGEGWGRPYLEAMAVGLPTIGTRGSGNEDFMSEANSFLVPTRTVPVPISAANEIPTYLGHQWCEPDEEALRVQMRLVYSNPEECRKRGFRASSDVRSRFGLEAGTVALSSHVDRIRSRLHPGIASEVRTDQIRVELEGELFASHSFSNINERLARGWHNHESLAVSLNRTLLHPTNDALVPDAHELLPLVNRHLPGGAQVVVRHAFPPNWEPPSNARWVHIQPWEFGALPVDWIRPLRELVDEIWVPSQYVRNVYLKSGIPAEKIQIVPWGIDPEIYRPDVPPLYLPHADCFRFLYVGGTVERKGFDYLWQAFCEEFDRNENVALVVKDVGTSTFYRIGNWREEILASIESGSNRVIYLEQEMTDGQRASLYTACDCLVAPYRGEGFGLPVLEGMACGLPPIIPAGGPTDDFTDPSIAYHIPAQVVESPHDWRMRGTPTELAIEVADLRRALRNAFEHRDELKEKGRAAAEYVRGRFTWQHSIDLSTQRLHQLVSQPPANRANEAVDPFLPSKIRPREAPLDLTVCLCSHANPSELVDCLSSWSPFVREIKLIVPAADQQVRSLAAEYGANVVQCSSAIDRTSMLNLALSRATSEWILISHPGEQLHESDLRQFCETLRSTPRAIGGISFRMPHRLPTAIGDLPLSFVRAFRNDHRLTLQGQAGELIEPAIKSAGYQLLETGFRLITGGTDNRNGCTLELLHSDTRSHRAEPLPFLNLGLEHWRSQNLFHAECYLWEALRRLEKRHRWYTPICTLLSRLSSAIGDPIRANDYALEATRAASISS